MLQISIDTWIANCKGTDQQEREEDPVLGPAGSYCSQCPGIISRVASLLQSPLTRVTIFIITHDEVPRVNYGPVS